MSKQPLVSIVMGSDSDLEIMREAGKALEEFGIAYEIAAPLEITDDRFDPGGLLERGEKSKLFAPGLQGRENPLVGSQCGRRSVEDSSQASRREILAQPLRFLFVRNHQRDGPAQITREESQEQTGQGAHSAGHDKTVLEPGMTFTSEPGIYLPGRFGVRIAGPLAWIDLRTLIFSVQRMAAAEPRMKLHRHAVNQVLGTLLWRQGLVHIRRLRCVLGEKPADGQKYNYRNQNSRVECGHGEVRSIRNDSHESRSTTEYRSCSMLAKDTNSRLILCLCV